MAKRKTISQPISPNQPKKPARTAKPPAARAARPRKTATLTPTTAGNGGAATTRSLVMPSPEQIAKRAYEIWITKGRPVGLDEQNWREAESELMSAAR